MGQFTRVPNGVVDFLTDGYGGKLKYGTEAFHSRVSNMNVLGPDKLPIGGVQSIGSITLSRTLTPVRHISAMDGANIYDLAPSPQTPIEYQLQGFMLLPKLQNKIIESIIARVPGEEYQKNVAVPDLNAWLSPMNIGIEFELPEGGYWQIWLIGSMPDRQVWSGFDILGGNNLVQEQLSLKAMRLSVSWKS